VFNVNPPSCVTPVGSSWTQKYTEQVKPTKYNAKCSTRVASIGGTVAKKDGPKT